MLHVCSPRVAWPQVNVKPSSHGSKQLISFQSTLTAEVPSTVPWLTAHLRGESRSQNVRDWSCGDRGDLTVDAQPLSL